VKFELTDPKTQTTIAIVMAVIGAIAQGTIALPADIPASVVTVVKSWFGFIAAIYLIVNAYMTGASKGPGPWASPAAAPPPAAPKAMGLAVIGLLALALAFGHASPAFAQPKPAPKSGDLPIQLLWPLPILKPIIPSTAKESPLNDIVAFIQGDLDAAEKQATAIGDGNLAACIAVIKPLAASLPKSLPVTLRAAADIANWRTVLMAAHKICEAPACTQVFSEASNMIAALGLGVPLVSPSAVCAKVSTMQIVAPPASDQAP
jgi:hypothetical protein